MSAHATADGRARAVLAGVRDEADARAYAHAVWACLVEPGDAVAGRLVRGLGAEEALDHVRADRVPDLPDLSASEFVAGRERWAPRLRRDDVDRALGLARRAGARLLLPGDPAWPRRLDDLGDHAPLALWVRGDASALHPPHSVALVGARAATGYGEHVAAELAAGAAASGISVVSGAAYGIDGAAHRGALSAGGSTVAFLAGGVDRAYPSGHADLLGEVQRVGAVVAEVACGTTPTKWRFLARNRLIAALGDATVVVEAGERSGSLNTAGHAAHIGRPLGAVPGPVTSAASAGCHRILREFDAQCISGVDDLRELVGLDTARASTPAERGHADLSRLLDALSTRTARTVDEVARLSGLAPAHVRALVGLALLHGLVIEEGSGWRRAPSR